MSARTLTQVAVAVLGVIALALGAILVIREGGATQNSTGNDGGSCDLTTMPSPLSPATEDVVLLLWPDKGVTVTLDGKRVLSLPEDPQSFAAGTHTLHAECTDRRADLELELRPFTPAAVHVACQPHPVFFVAGAACDDCPATDLARKAAAKAGKDSGQFAAAASQERLELAERSRAHGLLTSRWNQLTERYSRVLAVVGREAPGAVASANQRMEELSTGFKNATSTNDPIGQDQSIRAAEETLRVFVRGARLANPKDCEFQKRLTDSF